MRCSRRSLAKFHSIPFKVIPTAVASSGADMVGCLASRTRIFSSVPRMLSTPVSTLVFTLVSTLVFSARPPVAMASSSVLASPGDSVMRAR